MPDTKTTRAWFGAPLDTFAATATETIVGMLSRAAAERGLSPTPQSVTAWETSVDILKSTASELIATSSKRSAWHLLLEYELPRRSKRADAILLTESVVCVIEFKAGADRFDRAARWQAEEYALDLRDFHAGCRNLRVVPFLVATHAVAPMSDGTEPFGEVRCVNPQRLAATVERTLMSSVEPVHSTVDAHGWDSAPYRPTPSIVEAALTLYAGHDVREISKADAGNLDLTVDAIAEFVSRCQREGRHGIAFITGAPGSGKTLAGLQVAHDHRISGTDESAGVFLSGNMPLVEVISAALSSSARARGDESSTRNASRKVKTFIQHAYAFRGEYAQHEERKPHERIVLFDEAQRAWDASQVTRWTRGEISKSEPEILLEVMNRHSDWAVIIAMVGSGQEINRGEAGLAEWGRALRASHSDWLVAASPEVLPGSPERAGGRLLDEQDHTLDVSADLRLHLNMNVRSPRAEKLNRWVDALLANQLSSARVSFPNPSEYPFVITRSLDAAKDWLRDRTTEEQRCGLVANAGARRLRAWGLDTRTLKRERDWANWFLRGRDDIRASYQLEVPATNFDCQGLELDWVGICWGSDFVYSPLSDDWIVRRFVGTRWQKASDELRRFTTNSYRVLLTRARRGQVIWVPDPDGSDLTLEPQLLNDTYDLLRSAGVPELT